METRIMNFHSGASSCLRLLLNKRLENGKLQQNRNKICSPAVIAKRPRLTTTS